MDAFKPELLQQLATTRMPYGKYTNCLLIDLPEPYVCWFARKGFPKGSLGVLLEVLYEIKLNGLEDIVRPLKREQR